MGNRNSIKKRVSSPLTCPDSQFYLENYKKPCGYKEMLVLRKSPLYPRARCIFVMKSWESKNVYRLMGTRRLTRYYGIGILTDENRYYYNEYRMKNTILSTEVFADFTKIFIDGYIIDKDTAFMITPNMHKKSEQITAFFKLLARMFNNKVKKRDVETIANLLNTLLGRIFKPARKAHQKINNRNFYMFKNILMENGWFDFVGKELLDKINNEKLSKPKRDVALYTAIGILYMHILQMKNKSDDV